MFSKLSYIHSFLLSVCAHSAYPFSNWWTFRVVLTFQLSMHDAALNICMTGFCGVISFLFLISLVEMPCTDHTGHLFKVYRPQVFTISTGMCHHHLVNVEHFIFSETPCPSAVTALSSDDPQSSNLLYVCLELPIWDISYKQKESRHWKENVFATLIGKIPWIQFSTTLCPASLKCVRNVRKFLFSVEPPPSCSISWFPGTGLEEGAHASSVCGIPWGQGLWALVWWARALFFPGKWER